MTGDEDCLYLNVYVPESAGPEHRLPVMMWVFGGYFTVSTSTMSTMPAHHPATLTTTPPP